MRTRHAILAILGLGIAGLAVFLPVTGFRSPPEPPAPYPEFREVSPADLEQARRALPPVRDFTKSEGFRLDEKYDAEAALAGLPPLAVLAALHERESGPSAIMMYGPCFDDDLRIPVGAWLSRHADAALNDLLLRMASDDEFGFGLRDRAVAALCRAGNEAVLAPLLSIATDDGVNDTIRERVLVRVERIRAPLGAEVEALLSFPFDDLDQFAAPLLALTGRPVAPSLIRDALVAGWSIGDREHLLARAAEAIAPNDREVVAQARLALRSIEREVRGGTSRPVVPPKEAVAALAVAFTRWLAEHPEACTSRFEQERAAYRAGDRFARERRTLAADDPTTLTEEEIDFAAAALRTDPKTEHLYDRNLDALDRMAVFLRREMEDADGPEAKLALLHRRVLSESHEMGRGPEVGPPSFLDRVLSYRSGNCLGWTSLYVALADRIGLPIVPVAAPNHVFIRWDDGETVLDVELTAFGLHRRQDIAGRHAPHVITRKGLLSRVLINRANVWRTSGFIKDEDRYERALAYADEAVAWDPTCLAAHAARVQCLGALGRPADAARLAHLALEALEIPPGSAAAMTTAGDLFMIAGDPAAALPWYRRARKLDPGDVGLLRAYLQCLTSLGRDEDAIRDATEFLSEKDDRGVRLSRVRSMVRLDHDGWREELERLIGDGAGAWVLRMEMAGVLLGRGAWEDAHELLDDLDDLDEAARVARDRKPLQALPKNEDFQRMVDGIHASANWRRAQLLRARVLDAAGKPEEAKALRDSLPTKD